MDEWMLGWADGALSGRRTRRIISFSRQRGLDCSVVRAGRRKSSSMKSAPALVLFLALAALLLSPSLPPSFRTHAAGGRMLG